MGIETKLRSWGRSIAAGLILVAGGALQGCPGERLSDEEVRRFDNEVYQQRRRQAERFGGSGYVPQPSYQQQPKTR